MKPEECSTEECDRSTKTKAPCVLDHIAIAVQDLEKAIQTYTEGLGLSVLERRYTKGQSTGMVSAVLTGAGIPIVLMQGIEPDSHVTRFVRDRGAGVQHVAFAVTDLDTEIHEFAQLGLKPAFPSVVGDGIRQVFLEKNDVGPRFELIERKGGGFNDKSIQDLFVAMEERGLI